MFYKLDTLPKKFYHGLKKGKLRTEITGDIVKIMGGINHLTASFQARRTAGEWELPKRLRRRQVPAARKLSPGYDKIP